MSRWLTNVGKFLDSLDDQAAEQIDEIIHSSDDDDDDAYYEDNYKQVLKNRGLASPSKDDFDDDDDEIVQEDDNDKNINKEIEKEEEEEEEEEIDFTDNDDKNQNELNDSKKQLFETSDIVKEDEEKNKSSSEDNNNKNNQQETDIQQQQVKDTHLQDDTIRTPTKTEIGNENDLDNNTNDNVERDLPFQTPAQIPESKQGSLPADDESSIKDKIVLEKPPDTISIQREQELMAHLEVARKEVKEYETAAALANKEARTLRRHMVTLNEQLEAADREIDAQRNELEQVAIRIEDERDKHKKEQQAIEKKFQGLMDQMKQKHDDDMIKMLDKQKSIIKNLEDQLASVQLQRQVEGGGFTKLAADAKEREDDLLVQIDMLKDEKTTLTARVTSLQSQQDILCSRLESLTTSADAAMIRERDAEERLDEALTLHAKQITQRQAREAELEKTISELTAALVTERSKQKNNTIDDNNNNNDTTNKSNQQQTAGDVTGQEREEQLITQLEQEKEHVETLKIQIKELIQERNDESAMFQKRQQQYDNRVSELMQKNNNLQKELHEIQQRQSKNESNVNDDNVNNEQRIRNLTEEIIRQREKIIQSNTEISTLRTRLQVALNRATVAEAAAEAATTTIKSNNSNNNYDDNNNYWQTDNNDIEKGNNSMNKRRYRKKNSSDDNITTMSRAFKLQNSSNEQHKRIGKSLDILDNFLAKSGKILRFNPLIRLIFVIYLLVLHLWTLALLVFHAHSYETLHGDFGGHGPAMMMQQHNTLAKLKGGGG